MPPLSRRTQDIEKVRESAHRHDAFNEMGYNVIENIQWCGRRDQINHVHFRMRVPSQKYTETFIDAGDNDMMACLRALHKTGYPRLLHPDHVPQLPGDQAQRGGWGYAVGEIKAMMRQL